MILISPWEEILVTEQSRMSKLHFVSYTDIDDSGESYSDAGIQEYRQSCKLH